MTKEEISKTYDIVTQDDIAANPDWTDKHLGMKKTNPMTNQPLFIEHDHWFRIRAKFVWKDAPVIEQAGQESGAYGDFGDF